MKGEIRFTIKELRKLMINCYNDGYHDGVYGSIKDDVQVLQLLNKNMTNRKLAAIESAIKPKKK